jgi:hypothetical protein
MCLLVHQAIKTPGVIGSAILELLKPRPPFGTSGSALQGVGAEHGCPGLCFGLVIIRGGLLERRCPHSRRQLEFADLQLLARKADP